MFNNIFGVAEILEWVNRKKIGIPILILELGFILLNKAFCLLLKLVQKILTLCLQFCINTLLEKFRRQVGILLFKLISNLGLQLVVNLIVRPFFSFGKVHGLKPKHKTYNDWNKEQDKISMLFEKDFSGVSISLQVVTRNQFFI